MVKNAPEEIANWQRLAQENEALKARLRQMEAEKAAEAARQADDPFQTVLTRPDFIREVARMSAHDSRYGAFSSMLSLHFQGLEDLRATQDDGVYKQILRFIAEVLTKKVRACDIIGRTGPEDYAVYLTRCSLGDAEQKKAVLISTLEEKLAPALRGKMLLYLSAGIVPVEKP